LPDGSVTPDLNTYIEAWRSLVQPLVDATGWAVIGFDPGYQLATDTHDTLSLTKSQARTLASLVRK
jgi:hypothetical protein